jgi:hypothetical protein
MPFTLWSIDYESIESSLFKFQAPDLSSIKVFKMSAPYNGGENATFFQNLFKKDVPLFILLIL